VSSRTGLLLIGDSPTVGMTEALPPLLPGWRIGINGLGGRRLEEGMAILDGTRLPDHGSIVLAMGLFTNDNPSHLARLRAAVTTSLSRVGPAGCVVWATIHRSPVDGAAYAGANALLKRIAASDPRLQLVRWAEIVRARPSLLSPDRIHPGPLGFDLRAQLYANAAKRC
jgi:hypothetical protein